MLLRTIICFKDIGLFSGKNQYNVYGDEYSGNHVAIFECELKAPPQMAFVDHTYAQYLDAYRINFKNWRIVDIDNYMKGNSFFPAVKEESVWDKEVETLLGHPKGGSPPIWREEEAKENPHFADEVMWPMLREVTAQIEKMDTNSNRLMSPLHKKKEELRKAISESQPVEGAKKESVKE